MQPSLVAVLCVLLEWYFVPSKPPPAASPSGGLLCSWAVRLIRVSIGSWYSGTGTPITVKEFLPILLAGIL